MFQVFKTSLTFLQNVQGDIIHVKHKTLRAILKSRPNSRHKSNIHYHSNTKRA